MNAPSTRRRRFPWIGWLAVAALVCTIVLWVLFVIHWQALRRGSARQIVCLSQLRLVGMAMELYSYAWGDRRLPLYTSDQHAPAGKAWPDLLMPYMKTIDPQADAEAMAKLFRCPDSGDDRLTYSLNPRIAGLQNVRIMDSPTTIAVFDSVNDSPENNNLNGLAVWQPSDLGVPPVGSLVIWPERERLRAPKLPRWAKSRHQDGNNVLFADGHVKWMEPTDIPRFDPKSKEE